MIARLAGLTMRIVSCYSLAALFLAPEVLSCELPSTIKQAAPEEIRALFQKQGHESSDFSWLFWCRILGQAHDDQASHADS